MPNYDAFISYSHAADSRLAPAMQRALQRFAKPWWKLRALTLFRDETSLAAASNLGGALLAALGSARYFIFLASPRAAASKWCNEEVAYWLRHRSVSSLLIVLTEGTIAWSEDGRHVDWSRTNALPPALKDVLMPEPFWLDLSWVRKGDQLSERDPRFQQVVARLAAALHGRSLEDISGEDVRQHRRTRRVATGATAAMAALMLVAGAAAWEANRARDEAELQRGEARMNEQEAKAQRDEAQRQRAAAERNEASARQQRSIAEKATIEAVEAAFGASLDRDEALEQEIVRQRDAAARLVADDRSDVRNAFAALIAAIDDEAILTGRISKESDAAITRLSDRIAQPASESGGDADGVSIAQSANRARLALIRGTSVATLDLISGRLEVLAPSPVAPSFAHVGDGGVVTIVAADGSVHQSVSDASRGWKPVVTIGHAARLFAAAPTSIAIADGETVSVIDLKSPEAARARKLLTSAVAIALDASGWLYHATAGGGISGVDDAGAIRAVGRVPWQPTALSVSSDGRRLAIWNGKNGEVYDPRYSTRYGDAGEILKRESREPVERLHRIVLTELPGSAFFHVDDEVVAWAADAERHRLAGRPSPVVLAGPSQGWPIVTVSAQWPRTRSEPVVSVGGPSPGGRLAGACLAVDDFSGTRFSADSVSRAASLCRELRRHVFNAYKVPDSRGLPPGLVARATQILEQARRMPPFQEVRPPLPSDASPDARLAYATEYGLDGAARDPQAALVLYEKAANGGDPFAMYRAGILLEDEKDAESSRRADGWIDRAAAAKFPFGVNARAIRLRDAAKSDAALAEAAAEFERAMALGDGFFAPRNLGRLYEQGQGVRRSIVRALQLYRQAFEGGNTYAAEDAARLLVNADGNPTEEAVILLSRAARSNIDAVKAFALAVSRLQATDMDPERRRRFEEEALADLVRTRAHAGADHARWAPHLASLVGLPEDEVGAYALSAAMASTPGSTILLQYLDRVMPGSAETIHWSQGGRSPVPAFSGLRNAGARALVEAFVAGEVDRPVRVVRGPDGKVRRLVDNLITVDFSYSDRDRPIAAEVRERGALKRHVTYTYDDRKRLRSVAAAPGRDGSHTEALVLHYNIDDQVARMETRRGSLAFQMNLSRYRDSTLKTLTLSIGGETLSMRDGEKLDARGRELLTAELNSIAKDLLGFAGTPTLINARELFRAPMQALYALYSATAP